MELTIDKILDIALLHLRQTRNKCSFFSRIKKATLLSGLELSGNVYTDPVWTKIQIRNRYCLQ